MRYDKTYYGLVVDPVKDELNSIAKTVNPNAKALPRSLMFWQKKYARIFVNVILVW